MGNKFIHLHVHSDNSLLDGYGRIDEYIQKAKKLNMQGLALTDHHTLTGIYDFIKQCKKNNIKPIPGIEFNMAPITDNIMQPAVYLQNAKQLILNKGVNTHLTVLAKSNDGLRNLNKLFELSFKEDRMLFGVPRITLEDLIEYSHDLIVLTGCPNSELNVRLAYKQYDLAKEYLARLKSVFNDDLYVELMNWEYNHNHSNKELLKIAKEMNIEVVLTNDVHYAEQKDAYPQEVLMAIGNKSKMGETPSYSGGIRKALGGNFRHLASFEEMNTFVDYSKLSSAYDNTINILNKVNDFNFEYNPLLRPKIDLPNGFTTEYQYFNHLLKEGFIKKRGHQSKEIQEESKKRIKEERKIIYGNDFVGYFLVVKDYIDWYANQGYMRSSGRGSVGGSEIAYLLDISQTDPIRFDLLFERFISDGRGAILEVEYEDGTKEELLINSEKIVNGKKKFIYQLEKGDIIEES